MLEAYERMLESEELILSKKRCRRYIEPVIAAVCIPIVLIVVVIITLIVRPDFHQPLPFAAMFVVTCIFPLAAYRHQSKGLRLKSIATRHDEATNHKIVGMVIDKMGWRGTYDDGRYVEAVRGRVGMMAPSQMMAIVIADQKILLTSLSDADRAEVQGIMSFGKHEKNVEEFIETFGLVEEEMNGAGTATRT
jgi:hypothetical protein